MYLAFVDGYLFWRLEMNLPPALQQIFPFYPARFLTNSAFVTNSAKFFLNMPNPQTPSALAQWMQIPSALAQMSMKRCRILHPKQHHLLLLVHSGFPPLHARFSVGLLGLLYRFLCMFTVQRRHSYSQAKLRYASRLQHRRSRDVGAFSDLPVWELVGSVAFKRCQA